MSQSASVIESVNVEEESDEKPVINIKSQRSGQGKERRKSRLKLKTKLKNELSNISTVMEVKRQEMMRIKMHVNLTIQGAREVLSRRSREHLSSTIVNAVVYSHG